MTRIELAAGVPAVLDRVLQHLVAFGADDPADRIEEIIEAVQILGHSPLIGRKVDDGFRELVIGRKSRGYVALYRYVEEIDTAIVMAVRAQRESGFKVKPHA